MLNLILTLWIIGMIAGVIALLFSVLGNWKTANKLYLVADLLIVSGFIVILYWIYK